MTRKTAYKAMARFSAAALLAAAAACATDEPSGSAPEQSSPVKVVAEVARQLSSRSYQESGFIEEGIYYLTYPQQATGEPGVAYVDFHKPGSTPGLGIVTVPPAEELKWIDVGEGSTPTFYLDNVAPELADGTESTTTRIVFTEEENPFVAGLLKPDGSNDLLWGKQTANRLSQKTILFDMHHYMARLKVEVTVNHSYDEDLTLDLSNATVEISSLNQTPVAYNRTDGSLELETDTPERYQTLTLVDVPNSLVWGNAETKEEGTIEVYTTQDFVLPPQGLLEDERRPQLRIRIPGKAGEKERVYSGILPHAMEIDDDDPNHTTPSYPAALYFLREHILTIRTEITEEPPTLSFMPVKVVEWTDKGDFTIEAHQAGIYTAEEFYSLIQYYVANNEYQLTRYGRLAADEDEEPVWRFDFFHSVVLDYNRIRAMMKPYQSNNGKTSKNFSFNANNYTIFLLRTAGGTPEPVSMQQLYRIVTGTD